MYSISSCSVGPVLCTVQLVRKDPPRDQEWLVCGNIQVGHYTGVLYCSGFDFVGSPVMIT